MVIAEGCCAYYWRREDKGEIVLYPAVAPRELPILDEHGKTIEVADVTWCPVDLAFGSLVGSSTHGEHWRVHGGVIQLEGARRTEPGMLEWRSGARCGQFWLPQPMGVKNPPPRFGLRALTVTVKDDRGDAVPDAQVQLQLGDELMLGTWAAPGGLPAITGPDGVVLCEGIYHSRLQVRAFGYGFAEVFVPRDQTSATVVGKPLTSLRLRTVDAKGRPAPFTNLGLGSEGDYPRWTWVTTDSRGNAAAFSNKAVESLVVEPVGRAGGTPMVVRGGALATFQDVGPLVLIRIPPPDAGSSFCAGRNEAAGAVMAPVVPDVAGPKQELLASTLPTGTEAVLFRWTRDLEFWVQSVWDQPPVVVQRRDLMEVNGLLQVDRRKVVRRVPLHLKGDVPPSLTGLRAAPRTCLGYEVRGLPGNYAVLDPDQSVALASRDDHEHGVWILHPDLIPEIATVPAAHSAADVTVTVRRGAKLTIRFTPIPDFDACDRVFLTAVKADGSIVGQGEVDVPNRNLLERYQIIDVAAPFALPEGQLKATLWGRCMGGRSVDLEVTGTDPVLLEPGRAR